MGFFDQITDKVVESEKGPAPDGGGWSSSGGAAGVDVDAALEKLAASKGGGGNYKTSITDLLNLLGVDSSLGARKELAAELGVNAGEAGSAEQNIALHQAVMKKIAANGGKVSASLTG